MCRRMLGLHNCDVWHTFARSENHNDWDKGLTSYVAGKALYVAGYPSSYYHVMNLLLCLICESVRILTPCTLCKCFTFYYNCSDNKHAFFDRSIMQRGEKCCMCVQLIRSIPSRHIGQCDSSSPREVIP